MRIAVMSDTHGNLPALEAVLEDASSYHPDLFVHAGDLVGGPQVNQTIDLLVSIDTQMIRGNSDTRMTKIQEGSAPPEWLAASQFKLLRWDYQALLPRHLERIRALPEQRLIALDHIPAIRVVHGSPRSPNEFLYPLLETEKVLSALEMIDEAVMICGHTHQCWYQRVNGKLGLNPGSIGCPLNGDPRTQYALLTWERSSWHVEQRFVPYDICQFEKSIRSSGMLEEAGPLALAYLVSARKGTDIWQKLLDFAHQRTADAGFSSHSFIPDEIWDKACQEFEFQDDHPGD